MKQVKAKTKTKVKSVIYWDIKSPARLSDAARLERALNYGTWAEAQAAIKSLGVKKAARIFKQQSGKKRSNYRPLIANYFKLYFKKNA